MQRGSMPPPPPRATGHVSVATLALSPGEGRALRTDVMRERPAPEREEQDVVRFLFRCHGLYVMLTVATQTAEPLSSDDKLSATELAYCLLRWCLWLPQHLMQLIMFGYIWQYIYSSFLRCWLKWIWRHLTGKCELQRILNNANGAKQTHMIENSLACSKSKVLRSAVQSEIEVDKSVTDVMKEKKINDQKDVRFKPKFKLCLLQISGYKKLYLDVENLRKQPYDSHNPTHEEQLLELWNLLKPHEKLKSRVTKQWGDIGFQGDDPKTDFRGMGMLGLANLLYFSQHHTDEACQVLSHSYHPKMGYSYAIVGINLTEMAYSLLRSGTLKSHFYNLVPGSPQMKHFHQFFCYLIYEFDKFWFEEEPENIMHFNFFREKFHTKVKALLSDQNTVLILKGTKTI